MAHTTVKLTFKLGIGCLTMMVAAGICVAQADSSGYQCPGGQTSPRPHAKTDLGDVTKKAIHLARPKYPPLAKNLSASRIVKVQVVIDINSGRVVWAHAINGDPLLRSEIGKVVCQARFAPTHADGRVSGFIIYRFVRRR